MVVGASGLALNFVEGDQGTDPLALRMLPDVQKYVRRLSDRAPRLANSHKDCSDDSVSLIELLDRPIEDVLKLDVEIWNLSLALGEHLVEDSLNRAQGEKSLRPLLEADDRRALEAAVARLGTWVRLLPNARRLDEEYRAYNARPDALDAVSAILHRTEDRRHVLEKSTKSMMLLALNTAKGSGEQASKAGGLAVEGTKSLTRGGFSVSRRGFMVLFSGSVVAGIGKKVGEDIADETGLSKAIAAWLKDSANDIRKLFLNDPADLREAIDRLLDAPDDAPELPDDMMNT